MGDDVRAAQETLNAKVLGKAGVTGTAIGMKGGGPCLKGYVSEKGAASSIPKKVDGFPVVVETTGSFRRL